MDLSPEQQQGHDQFFGNALGKYLILADLEDGELKLVFSASLFEPIDSAIYTMQLAKKKARKLKPLPIEPFNK